MTKIYTANTVSSSSELSYFHPYDQNVQRRRDTLTEGMDHPMPVFGTEDPAQSSTCTDQNQLPVAHLPLNIMMHGNISLAKETEHSYCSIRHLSKPSSQNGLEYSETTGSQFLHHGAPLNYDTAAPLSQPLQKQPTYQPQQTIPSVLPQRSEQHLGRMPPAISSNPVRTQLEHLENGDCIRFRPITFTESIYNQTSNFNADSSTTAYAIDAAVDPLSPNVPDTYSTRSLGVINPDAESSHMRSPYVSRYNDTRSSLTSSNNAMFRVPVWDMARDSRRTPTAVGHQQPSIQIPQRGSEHHFSYDNSDYPFRNENRFVPASNSREGQSPKRTGGFINYTLKDQKLLSEGVSRSGGLKTRLEREKKAKQRSRELVRAVINAITTLGTDVDPADVQERVFRQCQRQT